MHGTVCRQLAPYPTPHQTPHPTSHHTTPPDTTPPKFRSPPVAYLGQLTGPVSQRPSIHCACTTHDPVACHQRVDVAQSIHGTQRCLSAIPGPEHYRKLPRIVFFNDSVHHHPHASPVPSTAQREFERRAHLETSTQGLRPAAGPSSAGGATTLTAEVSMRAVSLMSPSGVPSGAGPSISSSLNTGSPLGNTATCPTKGGAQKHKPGKAGPSDKPDGAQALERSKHDTCVSGCNRGRRTWRCVCVFGRGGGAHGWPRTMTLSGVMEPCTADDPGLPCRYLCRVCREPQRRHPPSVHPTGHTPLTLVSQVGGTHLCTEHVPVGTRPW